MLLSNLSLIVGELFGNVRKKLPWADSKVVKEVVDLELYKLLGERTAADNEKPVKNKKEKPVKTEVHTEVYFSDRSVLRECNSKDLLEKHMKATGGKVQTRFSPEPNGFLYIGHAKAMFVDFGLAKEKDGGCYLSFDVLKMQQYMMNKVQNGCKMLVGLVWD
ncbi:Glutamine--tRNA ligase [Capsicum chinense]|nr:Glutamine--tRNA ligase [Capsicum chinense]